MKEKMRQFDTGATRNLDDTKLDYEGFLSPIALERFAQYMHENRLQADGSIRDSDNWQKGIPLSSYMKSMHRHFMDVWLSHRGFETKEDIQTALCGLLFNVQGMLHTLLLNQPGEEWASTLDLSRPIHGSINGSTVTLEGWCRKCTTLSTFHADPDTNIPVCDNCTRG